MKITDLLTESETTEFNALLLEATAAGAGAIRYWSQASDLAIIGICQDGGLATWYCAPAQGITEALLFQAIVITGIAHTTAFVAAGQSNATIVAQDAIKKASKMH